MPKKKKKSRASTGGDEPKKMIFVEQHEDAPPAAFLSLRVFQSTSSPSRSLKYSPLIVLNQFDADSLDLISGDEVFLISNNYEGSATQSVQASVAKVHININNQGTSPIASPRNSNKQQKHNKLNAGNCQIFPVTLANSFLWNDNTSENTLPIPETPPSTAPKTPSAKTPVSISTPSSSKSKFSFSKGGGGDLLISPSSTPTNRNSSAAQRQPTRNIYVVPRQSDLGDHISSILCCNASTMTIEEVGKDASPRLNECDGPLLRSLILAHTLGSYMTNGTTFRLSFQGQFIDCRISRIEGSKSSVDDISESFTKLSLSQDSVKQSALLDSLKELGKKQAENVQLHLISKETSVATGKRAGREEKKEMKQQKPLVVGLDATIDEVKAMISTPLLHPELFSETLRPPKGVLLHGPSGTGKSCLALEVARQLESSIHIEHVNCTIIQSQTALVGQAERRLVELFEAAQKPRQGKSGSLVILDDVHLICPRREGTNLGADRLSATLLALLDGVNSSSLSYPFMILAITTNPSSLDPALRRPGRLDSEVEVPLPDEPSKRSLILQFHVESLGAKTQFSQAEWLSLARTAKGFTGADLTLAVKEAIRNTALKDIDSIDVANIEIKKEEMESAIRATKPSAIKAVTVEIPSVYWSSIGGMDNVKRELREAIELPMTHGEMFQKLGIRPPRGILMYGPPGCSKTLMARALATEGNMNFLAVKGPELLSKWLGESERALASLFRRARLASPSVIFFDEIDAIACKRSGNSSGGERLLSQLLTELDGIHSKDDASKKRRVVVVCATNRPDLLDDALMRPGRIDRMIYVGIPDEASRHRILEISLQGRSCADDIDIGHLATAEVSGGLSGAEMVAACRDAALMALEEDELQGSEGGRPTIRMRNMTKALQSMDRQIDQNMLDFYASFQGKKS